MLSDGINVTIGGKDFDLVLNTEAMAQLCDEFGDIEAIGDKLNNATYSEKIRLVPRLIAILATQGEAIKGNSEPVTAEYVLRHTLPKAIPALTRLFLQAVEIGMDLHYTIDDVETDDVLAGIQKNAQGAAGNN